MNKNWIETKENKKWQKDIGNLTVELEALENHSSYYVSLSGYGRQQFEKNFMTEKGLEQAKEKADQYVEDYIGKLKMDLATSAGHRKG